MNFSGAHYTVTGLPGLPKPIQRPHPPILIGSAGRRMLTLAAREADSIAPEVRPARPGSDEADATREDKVNWIREAAGERFDQLELCLTIYDLVITDSPSPAAPPPWGFARQRAMTTEQGVAYLREQHERLGFSYFHLFEGQIEGCPRRRRVRQRVTDRPRRKSHRARCIRWLRRQSLLLRSFSFSLSVL